MVYEQKIIRSRGHTWILRSNKAIKLLELFSWYNSILNDCSKIKWSKPV